MNLIVATWNIHRGIGVDRRCDLARTASVLAEIDADVVGLQEVESGPVLTETADQFLYLAEMTGYHAVAGPNLVHERGHYGNLLLSRWPVRETRLVDLSVCGYEPRGAIDVDLEVGGEVLRVLNTHLGLRRRERDRQVERLCAATAGHDHAPLLLLGDLNSAAARRELTPLGFAVPPSPRTFPARLPMLALDRVAARPARILGAVAAHRTPLARLASDHLPVVARLALDGPLRPA